MLDHELLRSVDVQAAVLVGVDGLADSLYSMRSLPPSCTTTSWPAVMSRLSLMVTSAPLFT